jgi:hypothetical protein
MVIIKKVNFHLEAWSDSGRFITFQNISGGSGGPKDSLGHEKCPVLSSVMVINHLRDPIIYSSRFPFFTFYSCCTFYLFAGFISFWFIFSFYQNKRHLTFLFPVHFINFCIKGDPLRKIDFRKNVFFVITMWAYCPKSLFSKFRKIFQNLSRSKVVMSRVSVSSNINTDIEIKGVL